MPYEKKPEPDLTDESLMPTGKWAGTKMIEVPAKYLLFIYECGMLNARVKKYIENNIDVINKEAKEQDDSFKE